MQLLYLIAMYGPQYLGNLIHRELGHEFIARGHGFRVFALASLKERAKSSTASLESADSIEENIAVHRALTAGTFGSNAVNALAKPLLHYDRFGMGWWTLRHFLAAHPEIDLVLAEGAYPFGAMAATALASLRTPSPNLPKLVITVAGGDFINSRATQYGYGRFRTARRLMRYAFARASAVRVTTPLVRERVLALGALPEKIALVPRNIAAYCFPPPAVPLATFRADARAALNSQYHFANVHLLLAVGRLLPIKGFDTLLRALPEIIARAGDTRLLLVGPNRIDPQHGDYQKFLERLAVECSVREKIIFTGAVPHQDMRALAAAADLIVVPSVLEGMNKIAVEGAAVATPSVVTRTAGIADLMTQANVGEIVEPNDRAALAERISALLNDAPRRAELGARGVVWAQQFSSRVVGAQLIDVCERVVS